MKITDLKINKKIINNLIQLGYKELTPIQEDSINLILEGNNIFGLAQTGSGKTAAFLVPLINKLIYQRDEKLLVIAPTRDLADQIFDVAIKIAKTTGIRCAKFVGGIKLHVQYEYLKSKLNVYVATPGRIIDLAKQRALDLSEFNYLVIDEADQMLDLGFINDIKYIISQMKNRKQTLLFSATSTDYINNLVKGIMPSYQIVRVKHKENINDLIKQKIYLVTMTNKLQLLLDILGDSRRTLQQCIIFTKTKIEATELASFLRMKKFNVDCLHSDRSMGSRTAVLKQFRNNQLQILVATNIAARGIDISNLPLVINFDIPEHKETYVHRIGRTGRAGSVGEAITFCSPKQKHEITSIEKLVKTKIEVIELDKYLIKNPKGPVLSVYHRQNQAKKNSNNKFRS